MTLLITVFAAVICTVIWYKKAPHDELKINVLCYMFWGASLMWLADAVFDYIKDCVNFFTPSAYEMLNDAFLALCVIALALIIWLVILLVKDPRGVIKDVLFKKNGKK